MNIVLCGFMGSGKSTVGKQLAKQLGLGFVDIDEYIEQTQSMKINEIFTQYGEDYFRDLEFNACCHFANGDNHIISTGGGAVTFERNVIALKRTAKIIFLDVPFDIINERIGDCKNRPLFKDKKKAKELYEKRTILYEKAADLIIDANSSINQVVKRICDEIK